MMVKLGAADAHFKEDHPERVDVDSIVILFFEQEFRRGVFSGWQVWDTGITLGGGAGQVRNDRAGLRGEDDIGRPDVSMNDTERMDRPKSEGNGAECPERVRSVELSFGNQ